MMSVKMRSPLRCVCGSIQFRPMMGWIDGTQEIVCLMCGRSAKWRVCDGKDGGG